ncbi:MAG: hypothetical protein JNL47_02410 [Bacteroidia bacterium]|nr:hypothetical protein [Bacteroidia bacterium]
MLEGALNYRTCTPHEYYDEIAIDSASRFITIEQSETDGPWVVSPDVLREFWEDLLTHAQQTAERLENGEYFNIVADLEIGHVDYEEKRIRVSVIMVAGINIYDIKACNFDPNTDY